MRIAIVNENSGEENRVPLTPDSVKRLSRGGWEVHFESLAGARASISDKAYQDAGATIHPDSTAVLKEAQILLCLGGQTIEKHFEHLAPGLVVIGHFNARLSAPWFDKACKKSLTVVALDLLPRITRAQSMDILSSQASLAGYRAVLESTLHYNHAVPMMMTAAGTISPARVFIMGVGVAGLQAIATARRLGAQVSATDVRFDTVEQVESLGATFVAVDDDEFRQAQSTVYAKEMSAEYKAKQTALVRDHLPAQDIVITTALIPGRPAPILLDEEAFKSMRPGAVIADLAASAGGNVCHTKPGQIHTQNDITILGHTNWPARVPYSSSQMLGGNFRNFLAHLVPDLKNTDKKNNPSKDGKSIGKPSHLGLNIDLQDEILRAVTLCHGGEALPPMLSAQKSANASKDSRSLATKKTAKSKTKSTKSNTSKASK